MRLRSGDLGANEEYIDFPELQLLWQAGAELHYHQEKGNLDQYRRENVE